MIYDELMDQCGSILQLHIDEGDPSTFVVGRLLHATSDWLMLRLISTTGTWDGLGLFATSDIVSFEFDTKYIKKLVRLLEIRDAVEQPIIDCEDDAFDTIIDFARRNNRILALELEKSGQRDVIGYVYHYDDSLMISVVDEMGETDGLQYIEIDRITRVYCADADLICLELLFAK